MQTSVASDIWALGMLIYRLLHGEKFCSEFENGLGDIVEVVTSGGFSRQLRWLPHVPDKWRRAVRRALHDEPNKRYRDPIQLAQTFQAQHIGIPWDCVWTLGRVTWTREKAGRQITVVRESLSERRHRWEAVSIGRQGGRQLTLGKSAGLLKPANARENSSFSSKELSKLARPRRRQQPSADYARLSKPLCRDASTFASTPATEGRAYRIECRLNGNL